MADAETEVLRRNYEIDRFNVVAEVKRTFINFLSAGKKLELNREAHKIATQLTTAVSDRVAAGAVSPIEETRAKVALAVSSADVEKWVREVETARRELAAAMGEAAPSFDFPSGDLDEDPSVPSADNVAERIVAAPDVIRWLAERNAKRGLGLRALAVPDVTLKGGVRHFQETAGNTFVLGFSVPLPLFNRNQGAIREAEAQRAKVDVERKATELLLRSKVGQRVAALAAAREVSLSGRSAPSAQSAYDAVSEGTSTGNSVPGCAGYRQGACRNAPSIPGCLTALNLARVDLERLTAVAPAGRNTIAIRSVTMKIRSVASR
jgi:cobalt-zinc-cadmium efflux system outer membrane protein